MIVKLKGVPVSRFAEIRGRLVLLDTVKSEKLGAKDVILMAENFYPADTPYMLGARGLLSLFGGILSHTALVAREFSIPAVVGVYDLSPKEDIEKVLSLLKEGKSAEAVMRGDGAIIVEFPEQR